jgi:hypothetical protein
VSMSAVDSPESLPPSVATSSMPWWSWLVRFGQRYPITARVTALFVLSRCAYLVIGWVAVHLVPTGAGFHPLTDYAAWDSLDYLQIAQHGYTRALMHGNTAFFPLYPLTIALGGKILAGNLPLAALVITNASWYVALLQLGYLVRDDFGADLVLPVTSAYLLFPLAFFCFVPYPEALYLACAIAAFRALRQQRWALAAALGGCAVLTRHVGIFLALPFLWEYGRTHQQPAAPARWWRWQVRPDVLWVALIPGGLALYCLWLWHSVGDPLAFLHAEATWHRSLVLPGLILWQSAMALFEPAGSFLRFRLWMDFLVVWTMVALVAKNARILPMRYLLYLIGSWGLFLCSPTQTFPLISQPRYILDVFPVFIVLGYQLMRYRWLRIVYPLLGVPLQVALFAMFVRGGWIT